MTTIKPDGLPCGGATSPSADATATPNRLLESAFAFWRSAVLVSAHDLGAFAELAAGPCAAEELANRLEVRQDAIIDLLDALATLGLVERTGPYYRNSPEACLYLDPAKPAYIGRWLAMAAEGLQTIAGLTARLRVSAAHVPKQHGLAARMLADIAEIQLSPRYREL